MVYHSYNFFVRVFSVCVRFFVVRILLCLTLDLIMFFFSESYVVFFVCVRFFAVRTLFACSLSLTLLVVFCSYTFLHVFSF